MTKEIRKKTTSVEPPDMPIDIDFKQKYEQHKKKMHANMKSQVFDDVVLPAYDLNVAVAGSKGVKGKHHA